MKYWELDDTKTNGNSLEQIEVSSQICYLKILFQNASELVVVRMMEILMIWVTFKMK
jgi:hypothetical protein